jgi:hypothetical protein
MADFIKSRLSGNLLDGLNKLSSDNGEAILRAGGFAGAKLIQEQAVVNAKKNAKTHVLENNIIVKRREEKSDGAQRQTYIVVVRKGKLNAKGDAFYADFVERGHAIRGRKKNKQMSWKQFRAAADAEYGNSRVPAYPYMRPAWETVKADIMAKMRERMKQKYQELMGGPHEHGS